MIYCNIGGKSCVSKRVYLTMGQVRIRYIGYRDTEYKRIQRIQSILGISELMGSLVLPALWSYLMLPAWSGALVLSALSKSVVSVVKKCRQRCQGVWSAWKRAVMTRGVSDEWWLRAYRHHTWFCVGVNDIEINHTITKTTGTLYLIFL